MSLTGLDAIMTINSPSFKQVCSEADAPHASYVTSSEVKDISTFSNKR